MWTGDFRVRNHPVHSSFCLSADLVMDDTVNAPMWTLLATLTAAFRSGMINHTAIEGVLRITILTLY